MILIEFTPDGGTLQRISTEDIALEYQWFSYVQSIKSIKLQLTKKHGGFAKPDFSDIALSPEMFESIGSYPDLAAIKIIETDTDEATGTIIYDGTATLDTYDRQSVNYILRQPELPQTIAKSTAYNTTLVLLAGTLCTAMGLTLDSTAARSPSPAVVYTAPKESLAIDVMTGVCAFFSHAFRISEGVLYLYDMLGARTPFDLTEFDVQRCDYRKDKAYSLISCGDVSIDGSDPEGDEYDVGTAYHGTAANVEAALDNIKLLLDMKIATIRFKADQDKPRILDQFTLLDESLSVPVNVSGTVGSIIYNYDTLAVEVEAYGSVTV